MSMMRELYTQILMDHYQRPRNRGELENHDLQEHLLNPLCGDEVTVYARFEGDKVAEMKFTGQGCSISQASASMMAQRLVGTARKPCSDARRQCRLPHPRHESLCSRHHR